MTGSSHFKEVLLEAIVVVVVGVLVGLGANAVSPSGLSLTRDYFPKGTNAPSSASTNSVTATNLAVTNTNKPSETDLIAQRLRDKGLREISRADVEKLSQDPRVQLGQIVFIDARDPDHYADGHLAGAYEFDPYHPEKEMNTVLPVCQAAEQVVVYCTGSECEDAETAAIMLHDAGIPDKNILVYSGGFTEWSGAHLPLEKGVRK